MNPNVKKRLYDDDVDLSKFSASENYIVPSTNVGGRNGYFLDTGEEGFVEWDVTIVTSGLYNINLLYIYHQLNKIIIKPKK